MINQRLYILLLISSVVFATSCRKDKPSAPSNSNITTSSGGGVFVTNEGNFLFGNATVSYYDFATGESVEDMYEPTNGNSLGDVCQSICLFNGKAYIVVNNSGKVEVVNPANFSSIATIDGFHSPRYFLPVSNSKAYVTDIYSDKISVVNLSTNTITGTIDCHGATEELALSYGKAFVTNTQRNQVYVINTATDILVDSIQVSYGSNSIKEDKNGQLWVLCSGNSSNPSGLFRINPITLEVEQSIPFSSSLNGANRLRINGTNDTLYFLKSGLYRTDINATSAPSTPFIAQEGRNFYGIGIDPVNNIVYIADAIDYVQRGMIYRYKTDGTLVNTFLAGIIPNDFCFN